MSDKPIAVLIAAAAAPLCAVCILGPAAFGSAIAWIMGWLVGLDPVAATGATVSVAAVVYGVVRRNRDRTTASAAGSRPPAPKSALNDADGAGTSGC